MGDLENEEDEQRYGERHQAEQLGKREAKKQAALLTVGGRRIAQRALEKGTEHEADTDGGSARTDRGQTGADHFRGLKVHLE
jgi:hypothetical protein